MKKLLFILLLFALQLKAQQRWSLYTVSGVYAGYVTCPAKNTWYVFGIDEKLYYYAKVIPSGNSTYHGSEIGSVTIFSGGTDKMILYDMEGIQKGTFKFNIYKQMEIYDLRGQKLLYTK